MRIQHVLLLCFAVLFSNSAHAGLMELSYSYGFTDSTIDDNNYTKTVSHTGSFAWYFLEMSALELSYSQGEQQISGFAAGDLNPLRYRTEFKVYGADLVFTFGTRESAFQPYIKGGAAWLDKKLYRRETPGIPEQLVNETDKSEPVPNLGVGFKFMLFKNFNFKASYERMKNGQSGDAETWDSTIRSGLSLYF